MKKHIPNFITLLNLLAGCLAIVSISKGELIQASWLIILAAIFDMMDGLLARLLNATSFLGRELDSLADVVSFGVAPGFILYTLTRNAFLEFYPEHGSFLYLAYVGFLVSLFAALRLAIFNTDPEQNQEFKGLPTPANALTILAIPIIINCDLVVIPWLNDIFNNPWCLIGLAMLLSGLMVSRIHLFSLKIKSIYWKHNRGRYIFIIAAIVMFFSLRFASVPFILLLYIILSQLKLNDPVKD